jgi:hypothetical protein
MSGFAGNGPSGAGRLSRYQFTLVAGQTLVSGKDDNSLALRIPIGMESVYFKGKKLPPTDYLVTSSSITLPGGAAAGDVLEVYAPEVQTNANTFDRLQDGADISDKVKFRSYLPNPGAIFGLTMSTAGASNTLTVAPGFSADSTNVKLMRLPASLAKTTAAFVVGAGGGLDTGAIAINTWYHFYQIYNPTTDASDIIFSTNAVAPVLTLASGYTLYRRIGSAKTNGSSQWVAFLQRGDRFAWSTPISDYNALAIGAGNGTLVLSVPTGVVVTARTYLLLQAAAGVYVTISDGLLPAQTANTPPGNISAIVQSGQPASAYVENDTNIVNSVLLTSSGSGTLYVVTLGWSDARGRNG